MLAIILSSVALCLSAVASVFGWQAVAQARRGAPNQLVEGLRVLSERVVTAEETVGAVRANMVSWSAEIEGVLTAVEDALGRVEKKRRSTASSAARIERAEPTAPTTDVELFEAARRQGLI